MTPESLLVVALTILSFGAISKRVERTPMPGFTERSRLSASRCEALRLVDTLLLRQRVLMQAFTFFAKNTPGDFLDARGSSVEIEKIVVSNLDITRRRTNERLSRTLDPENEYALPDESGLGQRFIERARDKRSAFLQPVICFTRGER